MRQEGVALAQWLQLLTLTQRGPCAVLGAQRGLRRCGAGTHTHTHTERQRQTDRDREQKAEREKKTHTDKGNKQSGREVEACS